jgi:hypothetical protein
MRGRPLGDWLEGTNVTNDGSLVNHSIYHPDYMTTITESISGGLVPALAGDPLPTNALHGTSLEYDALVDKQWSPPPAVPCSGSPAFIGPGAGNPTGTMYVDGSDAVYYPEGNDWGTTRRAHFATLDAMVRGFGLDSLVAEKADYWEDTSTRRRRSTCSCARPPAGRRATAARIARPARTRTRGARNGSPRAPVRRG